jgi:hypothetical protein
MAALKDMKKEIFKMNQYIKGCAFIIFIITIFLNCKSEKSETVTDALKSDLPGNPVHDQGPIAFDSTLYEYENGLIKLNWEHLLSVKFSKQFNEDLGFEVDMPLFSDTLKALNGRDVIAEGFYIPVDETGDESIVILSAYPFAQCFFCGAAGAESVIDVLNIGKLPRLKLDQKIRFKGRLRLNKDNFDFLIYVLEEAELLKG